MSDQQLIDCSTLQLADGVQAKSEKEMGKLRINAIAHNIGLRTGSAPDARIDERETSNGITTYHQIILKLEELALLDTSTLDGLEVQVTIAAYQGSYTGKTNGDDGMAKIQALLNPKK
jgi:hypothetical protein